MSTTHDHHVFERNPSRRTPYRSDPQELAKLTKIIGAICVFYYFVFASGMVTLHPNVERAADQAISAQANDASK